MDYDPLSAPTRKTRRSLIAVSGIAIIAKMFCARIEQLPIGGVSIRFDSGFLDFVLLAALIYLLGLLIYYLRIDWNNRGRTPAQIAESEARQAVLVEVERDVRGAATNAAMKTKSRQTNPDVVDDVVGVFWRFKSKPDATQEEIHAALASTHMAAKMFGDIEAVMRESWKEVDSRTAEEAERSKQSKIDEKNRFRIIEAGIPIGIAVIALIAFAAPNFVRDTLGFDSCEAPGAIKSIVQPPLAPIAPHAVNEFE